MNICHIITRLIIGGAQENTVLTCRGLAQRGHQVTLIAGPETGPEGSLWPAAEASGCRLMRLPSMVRAVRPWSDVAARQALVRLLRAISPHVVHTHSSKAGILGRSAAAAAGVPVVVHTIHGMSFNRTQSGVVQWMYKALERRAARYTTRFVTVADAMIEQAVQAGLAPQDRFVTVRSGMVTDDFHADARERAARRAEWGIAADEVVVGTIARLFDNKGYDEIIAAMPLALRRAPRLRFVWVGDGARRPEYEARLRKMGVRDRVTLVGLVPPEDVHRYVKGFDLLVHASRWEGLPRAAVQALLCEVPVVAFDNDGAPEVVRDGVTGRLIRYGDVTGLAVAMAELAADTALRACWGAAGRQHCLRPFDWRTMVEQLEQLYEQLVGPARQTHVEFWRPTEPA